MAFVQFYFVVLTGSSSRDTYRAGAINIILAASTSTRGYNDNPAEKHRPPIWHSAYNKPRMFFLELAALTADSAFCDALSSPAAWQPRFRAHRDNLRSAEMLKIRCSE